MNTPNPPDEIKVPLERVARFVRQLTHDVRNGLSAVDLETAFIAEISADEEVLAELHKLREMIAETAKMLRRVSQYFHPVAVHPIQWSAATVMQEIQKTAETEFPDEEVGFENRFQAESVEIDLQLTQTIVLSILRNALQFRRDESPITVTGTIFNGKPAIEILERRVENPIPPAQWGTEPLLSTRPGGYGLELYQARQIVTEQGGSLDIEPTGEQLLTRLTLPIEKPKEE
ncbi:MAG: hypothetical protein ACFUZC_06770 [Chthoniobacteraceae bacterium]